MGAMHDHHLGRLSTLSTIAAASALTVLAAIDHSALIAQAALHTGLDVGTLVLARGAQRFARRGPDARSTFGWQRVDVLTGAVLAVVVALASTLGVDAAVREHSSTPGVSLACAAVLAAVPAWPFFVNARTQRTSTSARALSLHAVADLGAFLATLLAALAAWTSFARLVDVGAAVVIWLLVVVPSAAIVRDAVSIALDLAPRGVTLSEVARTIAATPGVVAVHHLHVWRLDPTTLALSAHVVAQPGLTLHDSQLLAARIRERLAREHGIAHTTLELECHACAAPRHEGSPKSGLLEPEATHALRHQLHRDGGEQETEDAREQGDT